MPQEIIVPETKFNSSFPVGQFMMEGYITPLRLEIKTG